MSQWKHLQTILSLTFRRTLGAFGFTTSTLLWGAVTLGLGVFIHWHLRGWPAASEELSTFIMYSFAPTVSLLGLLFLWNFLWYAPYCLHAQLSDRLAKTSGVILRQLGGHGDNLQSTYGTSDSWFVLVRDVILVNPGETDDSVSLALWWPLKNNSVTFSPQTIAPSDIGQVSLLDRAVNIPSRQSVTGSLFFRIPKSTAPTIAAPFLIIIVTSQLTGTERAFNSLTFTEVTKPYPRTLEELNRQLASAS